MSVVAGWADSTHCLLLCSSTKRTNMFWFMAVQLRYSQRKRRDYRGVSSTLKSENESCVREEELIESYIAIQKCINMESLLVFRVHSSSK